MLDALRNASIAFVVVMIGLTCIVLIGAGPLWVMKSYHIRPFPYGVPLVLSVWSLVVAVAVFLATLFEKPAA